MLKARQVRNLVTGDIIALSASSAFEAALWAYCQNDLGRHDIAAYGPDPRVTLDGEELVITLADRVVRVYYAEPEGSVRIGDWKTL